MNQGLDTVLNHRERFHRIFQFKDVDRVCDYEFGYWDAPGVAWEIYTFVKQGGMKPMDAIISATKTNAENCVLPEVGTLEVGKIADLILVDGDPVKDIMVLQDRANIGTVIKEGHLIVEDGKINW